MATKLGIANMALGFLAEERAIDSLEVTRGNPNAVTINKYYRSSKEITLAALDWKFARKRRIKLELLETLTENNNEIYVWAYPRDFLTKPTVHTTHTNGYRYKVSFDSYSDDTGRPILETCYNRCDMTYTWDIPEERYFPRLGLLQAYKLAALARNEVNLGDGAITREKLEKNFAMLLAEMGESEYQLSDTQTGEINTFEQARFEGVQQGDGEYYY